MICVHTVKMVKHTVKMARIAYIQQGILLTMSFHRNPHGMLQTVHNYKIPSVCPCAAEPMIYFIEFCE